MFSIDRWQEIFASLWQNRLRSLLTALSVAWGIFMLVILLGLGKGMQTGVASAFNDDATNSIWVFSGATSLPHDGLPVGRRVVFENRDVATIDAIDGVDKITGRFFLGGNRFSSAATVRAEGKISSYDIRAVHPDHLYLEKTIMTAGRFVNDMDITEKRKIAVLGEPVARFLFGTTDVVGQRVLINSIAFNIVGVFTDEGDAGETERIYIPITTGQAAYNGGERVNMMMFTIGNLGVAASKALATQVQGQLAERLRFSPDDPQAVRMRNNVENFETFMQVFRMMDTFVWIMAGCALLAGAIGVSNIMMIVVRERTKEIGVRKALGATPWSIVSSIVQESLFLTAASGYLGLCAAVGTLALIETYGPKSDTFANPSVDMSVALTATGILAAVGAVAGYFPARAAARVNPIVALRDE